ncbi:MAG TPA: tRNA preQ1(34) S-adenosylmethionine ribosyltransferase-isomerase QueA [Candidatus Saccharimonadia bacterium]|nr:tRNA preQ1(34) S-adenosylmethionine ribosyltransferase-isomerase QueA [Candidatus Saccharimonadia bacterium]
MLTLSDFDYHLPEELIAQKPAQPRDHSRLLVVDRETGKLEHHYFYELPDLLRTTDVLVLNNSKTLPMRTYGQKDSGGRAEVLFIKRLELFPDKEIWEVLTKPGLKVGQSVGFEKTAMRIHCVEDLGYTRKVEVMGFEESVVAVLHAIGELPTPHYIRRHLENQSEYQTIYAKPEGSAATPTAGLHFSQSIFDLLDKKGIPRIELTLHVGLGTFLPVKVENIANHNMHAEWFTLSKENADKLNVFKREGRRIIAVGTTSSRVLESCAVWNEKEKRFLLEPKTGETKAFFYPPYTFKFVDALITNFHLPKSTLLMLLSAFVSQGKIFTNFQDSLAGKAYAEAIAQKYRFFSFGDAMMII